MSEEVIAKVRLPSYEDLSKEQDDGQPTAIRDGDYVVAGPPGTGKTVIALYRAQAPERHGEAGALC